MSNPVQPPSYNFPGIDFNPSFYTSNTDNTVSAIAYADSTFLKKIGTAISNASITTFSGEIVSNGPLVVSGTTTFNNNIPTTPLINSSLLPEQLATVGYVNGQSATAEIVDIINTTSNISYKFPLVTSSVSGSYPLYSGGSLSYNPSTNILTTNLSGNATTSTLASTVTMSLTSANTNLPLLIGSTVTGGPISILSDANIFVNPSTNTLTCPQITGNASSATTATTSTNLIVNNAPSSSTNYYLGLATTNFGANNAIVGANALRFVTNTGTLATTILSATASTLSPLYNTTNGGTVRLTGTTGQYSQLQQSSSSFGYDLNAILPSQGAFNITTVGTYVLPTSPAVVGGLGIGYNATGTQSETDFVNYAQGSIIGGFNFYTLGTNTISLIGQLPRSQPISSDSSTTIPTTAWVQTAIQNSGVSLQYYNYKLYGISSNVLTQSTQNIIINIPQASFSNATLPWQAVKIRFIYSIYDSTGAIAYSNNGILNIYPMNIVSYVVSPAPNYTFVLQAGLDTGNPYNFNITNGMCSAQKNNNPPTFNYLSTYYADGLLTSLNSYRWYWVSNVNGGSPSGFPGVSAWFNYLNYSYNGAGQFKIGFNTPPYNNAPLNQGPPGFLQNTTLNMNILFELVSNDFTGSTVSFSSS